MRVLSYPRSNVSTNLITLCTVRSTSSEYYPYELSCRQFVFQWGEHITCTKFGSLHCFIAVRDTVRTCKRVSTIRRIYAFSRFEGGTLILWGQKRNLGTYQLWLNVVSCGKKKLTSICTSKNGERSVQLSQDSVRFLGSECTMVLTGQQGAECMEIIVVFIPSELNDFVT